MRICPQDNHLTSVCMNREWWSAPTSSESGEYPGVCGSCFNKVHIGHGSVHNLAKPWFNVLYSKRAKNSVLKRHGGGNSMPAVIALAPCVHTPMQFVLLIPLFLIKSSSVSKTSFAVVVVLSSFQKSPLYFFLPLTAHAHQ